MNSLHDYSSDDRVYHSDDSGYMLSNNQDLGNSEYEQIAKKRKLGIFYGPEKKERMNQKRQERKQKVALKKEMQQQQQIQSSSTSSSLSDQHSNAVSQEKNQDKNNGMFEGMSKKEIKALKGAIQKEKNRISAQVSRDKKKQENENMQKKITELENEIADLKIQLEQSKGVCRYCGYKFQFQLQTETEKQQLEQQNNVEQQQQDVDINHKTTIKSQKYNDFLETNRVFSSHLNNDLFDHIDKINNSIEQDKMHNFDSIVPNQDLDFNVDFLQKQNNFIDDMFALNNEDDANCIFYSNQTDTNKYPDFCNDQCQQKQNRNSNNINNNNESTEEDSKEDQLYQEEASIEQEQNWEYQRVSSNQNHSNYKNIFQQLSGSPICFSMVIMLIVMVISFKDVNWFKKSAQSSQNLGSKTWKSQTRFNENFTSKSKKQKLNEELMAELGFEMVYSHLEKDQGYQDFCKQIDDYLVKSCKRDQEDDEEESSEGDGRKQTDYCMYYTNFRKKCQAQEPISTFDKWFKQNLQQVDTNSENNDVNQNIKDDQYKDVQNIQDRNYIENSNFIQQEDYQNKQSSEEISEEIPELQFQSFNNELHNNLDDANYSFDGELTTNQFNIIQYKSNQDILKSPELEIEDEQKLSDFYSQPSTNSTNNTEELQKYPQLQKFNQFQQLDNIENIKEKCVVENLSHICKD